jgi:flagellar assembly factor FliW
MPNRRTVRRRRRAIIRSRFLGQRRAPDKDSMPLLATKYFGTLPCEAHDFYDFPFGIPGFEEENRFVLLNIPGKEPLVFLQSAQTATLCFLALPVLVADPRYSLSVSIEDLRILELEPSRQPHLGGEVLVLALLAIEEGKDATANLLAPIVINLATRRAVQAIRCDALYSHRQALPQLVRGEAC